MKPKKIKKMTMTLMLSGGLMIAWAMGTSASAEEGLVQAIDAEVIWQQSCASCHGRDGKGQTRVGRRAGVKDMTDHEYQKSFTNEEAFEATKKGLTRDGRELMKPFGKGLSEDNGLTDEEIEAVIKFVRGLDPKWTD